MECKSKDFSLHGERIESFTQDLLQKAAERYAAVFLSAKMSKIVIRISFLSRNESDIYSQSDSDFTMPSPVSLVYASYLLQNEEKSYSDILYIKAKLKRRHSARYCGLTVAYVEKDMLKRCFKIWLAVSAISKADAMTNLISL